MARLPRVLQFTGAYVIEFTFDGEDPVATSLGGGFNVATFASLYNFDDGMVYLFEPTEQGELIRYDPAINAIVDSFDVVAAYGDPDLTLIDIRDGLAWFANNTDVLAISLVDYSLAFTMAGGVSSFLVNASMALSGGRAALIDQMDAERLHIITITGPTSWTDEAVQLPATPGFYSFGEWRGGHFYVRESDEMFFPLLDDTGQFGVFLDLNSLTTTVIPQPSVGRYINPYPPYWDARANVFVVFAEDTLSDDTGVIVDVATKTILGGIGPYDYPQALHNGQAIMWGNGRAYLFDEADPDLPGVIVPGNDYAFAPSDGYTVIPPPPDTFFWHSLVRAREELSEF